jgi:hypothetical protein
MGGSPGSAYPQFYQPQWAFSAHTFCATLYTRGGG